MKELTVTDSFSIADRGAAALLEPGHIPLALGSGHRIRIVKPDGCSLEADAVVESSRKMPPGESIALLFEDLGPGDIPPGSRLTILDK